MRTMTTSQIGLICRIIEKDSIRFAERQASIIWNMAQGKYKPMRESDGDSSGKTAVKAIEKLFGIEDKN